MFYGFVIVFCYRFTFSCVEEVQTPSTERKKIAIKPNFRHAARNVRLSASELSLEFRQFLSPLTGRLGLAGGFVKLHELGDDVAG